MPGEAEKRRKKAELMDKLSKHFPVLPGEENEEEPLSMEEPNDLL